MPVLLEDVFKKAGVPTHTFVAPTEYTRIVVALRTPGRAVIIEGPSGIGKTSCVKRALEQLGMSEAQFFSARRLSDLPKIEALSLDSTKGVVVVDDFHRLEASIKRKITDYVKLLADDEASHIKIVLIGINRAGQSLVDYAPDLLHRVEPVRFGRTSIEKLRELIALGEKALNCKINVSEEIADEAQGSFAMAQVLCHEACIQSGLMQKHTKRKPLEIAVSLPAIREAVLAELGTRFGPVSREFCKGKKIRKEGRAPYLHLLKWLSETHDGALDTKEAMARNPPLKGSVSQVIEKGHLATLINSDEALSQLLFFDVDSDILTTEDPKFHYYIRHLIWSRFSRQVGYISIDFNSNYDFALSFAGDNRDLASRIFEELDSRQIPVFYDKNEQSRIIANDVEEYLAPIYRSEASYILALLSPQYPSRIWTKFESNQFKDRFGSNSIIPIVYKGTTLGLTDRASEVGYLSFDPDGDIDAQAKAIVEILVEKIKADRAAVEEAQRPTNASSNVKDQTS